MSKIKISAFFLSLMVFSQVSLAQVQKDDSLMICAGVGHSLNAFLTVAMNDMQVKNITMGNIFQATYEKDSNMVVILKYFDQVNDEKTLRVNLEEKCTGDIVVKSIQAK